MWKLLCAIIFLSVDAQKLKLNLSENGREGIDISNMIDVETYQEAVTYRLPNDTRPETYLINLNFGDFHENDMSFTGNVLISIRVVENTDEITLHSSVTTTSTSLTSNENIPILYSIVDDPVREFMVLKTNEILLKGSVVRLRVFFRGTIGTSVSGIYRGSYLHNGNERR